MLDQEDGAFFFYLAFGIADKTLPNTRLQNKRRSSRSRVYFTSSHYYPSSSILSTKNNSPSRTGWTVPFSKNALNVALLCRIAFYLQAPQSVVECRFLCIGPSNLMLFSATFTDRLCRSEFIMSSLLIRDDLVSRRIPPLIGKMQGL